MAVEAAVISDDASEVENRRSRRFSRGLGSARSTPSVTKVLAYTAGALGVACSVLTLAHTEAERRISHLSSVSYDRRVLALKKPLAYGQAVTGGVALSALLSYGVGKLTSHLQERSLARSSPDRADGRKEGDGDASSFSFYSGALLEPRSNSRALDPGGQKEQRQPVRSYKKKGALLRPRRRDDWQTNKSVSD